MIRAWFKSYLGHTFSKDFQTGDELEKFIERANSVGTTLIGFASI